MHFFRVSVTVCLFAMCFLFSIHTSSAAYPDFYAYYTKVAHSATDYIGKYADIIVVLGENKQLEFTRRTGYLPKWKTASYAGTIDDLFPGRDQDYEFNYTYVRLIENGEKKIVIHWRYYADIATLKQANRELNPLIPHGFTGVIHELFTIYPDGRVEREVREAAGTRSNDWLHADLSTKQQIKLNEKGIEHGTVRWGRTGSSRMRPAVSGNPVKEKNSPSVPILNWRFDEGLEEHEDLVFEESEELESQVEGLMTVFKKGVSGTALAFDGYTTGIEVANNELPDIKNKMTLECWVALDAYPYNNAPFIHQSQGFGKNGYYFGLDAYGHLLFTVNGMTVKSQGVIPLHVWTHVAATYGDGKMAISLDGKEINSSKTDGDLNAVSTDIILGINSEKESCTDYVRTPDQNLPFIYGIQGLLDEVSIYDNVLNKDQLEQSYKTMLPADRSSSLARGVLPGENGISEAFGAKYTNLKFHELWDNMWRTTDYPDIVVKFDNNPCSVVYWRGANSAASWVTDNNRWMADQSSEIFTKHGCSEHMADKQNRHSYARIIENTPARVVIHWRYPCVDVSYYCANRRNWSDEYHTIYPDGSGIRKVVWNKGFNTPGFQDIQFFTNPGEDALDVVNIQAMTIANLKGDTRKLTWAKPNIIPENTLPDACIELLNSKSEYKVYAIFQGGFISPWGKNEQSKYTDDPFAGPWNHWPVHFVPSDGRFAVANDRVTHFAIGANDATPEFGSLVRYGFTQQDISTLIPQARSWHNPAELVNLKGAKLQEYDKNQAAYLLTADANSISFKIVASKNSPLYNPCFVLHNWAKGAVAVSIDGENISPGPDFRQGETIDIAGKPVKVVWLKYQTEIEVKVRLTQK